MSCKDKNKDLLMRQKIAFANSKKTSPNSEIVEMFYEGSLDNLAVAGINLDSILSIVKRGDRDYIISYRQEIN